MHYYNENNSYCAQWLHNLIAAGRLSPGDVDDRDIRDVRGADLREYRQCHFFAGIGGWPLAAHIAEWPRDRELWTGSCPCQPLSIAGQRRADADERHLWPAFYRLIAECRPSVVAGEQVSGPLGREWLAGVRADMEDAGYACGCADLPACAVGAPHARRRLYWIAERMGYTERDGCPEGRPERARWKRKPTPIGADASSLLGDAYRQRKLEQKWRITDERRRLGNSNAADRPWRYAQDIWCDWDQKTRRAEPGISWLVDGFPGRVAAFSAFGNAVVVPLAAEFLGAFLDCRP